MHRYTQILLSIGLSIAAGCMAAVDDPYSAAQESLVEGDLAVGDPAGSDEILEGDGWTAIPPSELDLAALCACRAPVPVGATCNEGSFTILTPPDDLDCAPPTEEGRCSGGIRYQCLNVNGRQKTLKNDDDGIVVGVVPCRRVCPAAVD
jgi:hypothetical protein